MMPALLLITMPADAAVVIVDTPMAPPSWAVLEQELLRVNAEACREFFERYFDERGYLLCVERWGGDDGPDDAIENVNDWPLLHMLGGAEDVRTLYTKAWDGHLRQFTEAKTVDVPFARDGMYYKEFPVMMDWVHNGEGINVFNLMGLSHYTRTVFGQRVRRYAGFYMNEDPQAPNYDPEHKIIRSLFNGSRGPLMRKATGLDWAGDPIEVKGRFRLRHGEDTYEQMVFHFKDYNDIIGDHPQNMAATSLAVNAYMLAQEPKYRQWVLEYVDAWLERVRENGGIIPTNIGLDGTIGGATDGKWYGGVYGWGFTVEVPQTGAMANRNTHGIGLLGFGNALLLTGDQKYVDVWRTQIDKVNANAKVIDGKKMYPSMYGDDGWYAYGPSPYATGAVQVWYWSMNPDDLERIGTGGWNGFLAGRNDNYPEQQLRSDFVNIRNRVQAMRNDTTTPDTRLSDDPMPYNPATVRNLVNLMLGGIHPGHQGSVLHCRVRYFDPVSRRAGVPKDVGALVENLRADQTTLTLVNTSPLHPRRVIVQGGAYGEHQTKQVRINGKVTPVDGPCFEVQLAPGTGARLVIDMKRYANQPTLAHPWDRAHRVKN
jgi:hypothetical protein